MTTPSNDWKSAFFSALAGTAVLQEQDTSRLVLRASEIADAAEATIRGRTKATAHPTI